jgi:hypothetical protein
MVNVLSVGRKDKMLKVKVAKGLIRWFLHYKHFAAITIPHCGIYVVEGFQESPYLIRHERKHEEQIKKLGTIRFLITYFYFCAKYGYYNNPLEIEARSVE